MPCWWGELDARRVLGRLEEFEASRGGGGEASSGERRLWVEEVVAAFEARGCGRRRTCKSSRHRSTDVNGGRSGEQCSRRVHLEMSQSSEGVSVALR